MEIYQGIILGILQGLTEFLPVSSSGHLALGQIYSIWGLIPIYSTFLTRRYIWELWLTLAAPIIIASVTTAIPRSGATIVLSPVNTATTSAGYERAPVFQPHVFSMFFRSRNAHVISLKEGIELLESLDMPLETLHDNKHLPSLKFPPKQKIIFSKINVLVF